MTSWMIAPRPVPGRRQVGRQYWCQRCNVSITAARYSPGTRERPLRAGHRSLIASPQYQQWKCQSVRAIGTASEIGVGSLRYLAMLLAGAGAGVVLTRESLSRPNSLKARQLRQRIGFRRPCRVSRLERTSRRSVQRRTTWYSYDPCRALAMQLSNTASISRTCSSIASGFDRVPNDDTLFHVCLSPLKISLLDQPVMPAPISRLYRSTIVGPLLQTSPPTSDDPCLALAHCSRHARGNCVGRPQVLGW